MAKKYLREPETLAVDPIVEPPAEIDHVVIEVYGGNKLASLTKLLDEPSDGGTLVFGRTRRGVRNLGQRLRGLGYDVGVLEGDLSQRQRDRAIDLFRSGRLPILVATNVAARGLDILHITRVINYDLPETHELFIHRVGRTGRMGRSGLSISLVNATELPKLHLLERSLGKRLPRITGSIESHMAQAGALS